MARSLCYLYCRCSRSVSIATPAYYAHLAAARGKIMIIPANLSDIESTISGASMMSSTVRPPSIYPVFDVGTGIL